MNIAGLFLQDDISFAEDRIRVSGALRFDHANFYDGAFTIAAPTGETTFMYGLVNPALNELNWNALSPKLSALFLPDETSRIYISWARGFRQPVLDELCRSGRIKGGFKLANPSLGPETIDNFEIGADKQFGDRVKASLSAYQSIGRDFMYYVNTGDSIDMGFGLRPILSRENITGISITGLETEVSYQPLNRLSITGVYALNRSVITSNDAGTSSIDDLTGKYLTDVPFHSASVRLLWLGNAWSAMIMTRYTSASWVNDLNVFDEIVGADRYPAYFSTDLKGSYRFNFITASLSVQNIFNQLFFDSKGAMCPGRFITFETSVKF
jgi:iron complex outermembrane receptor protein